MARSQNLAADNCKVTETSTGNARGEKGSITLTSESLSSSDLQLKNQRKERLDYINFESVSNSVMQPKHLKRQKQDVMIENVACSH